MKAMTNDKCPYVKENGDCDHHRNCIYPNCEQQENGEGEAANWRTMDSAPKEEIIEITYGDGSNPNDNCLAVWSERPVCMLGSVKGGYPAGWATAGDDTDKNLPLDPPNLWRPQQAANSKTGEALVPLEVVLSRAVIDRDNIIADLQSQLSAKDAEITRLQSEIAELKGRDRE